MHVTMSALECGWVIVVSALITAIICGSVASAVDIDTLRVLAIVISVKVLAELIGRC
jgi:hypothetical protein